LNPGEYKFFCASGGAGLVRGALRLSARPLDTASGRPAWLRLDAHPAD